MTVQSWNHGGMLQREVAAANITDAWHAALKELEHPNCRNVTIRDGQGSVYEITVR